jgi:two-component system KDP operon response regulator KdpE
VAAPLVLIVDDEPAIRRFLRASLVAHDYRVSEAITAQEALTRAFDERPDIVLLDLGLPDRDGLVVIRELRQFSPVPIVVLSARHAEKDKVRALDEGADDYLAKPFGVEELLARVRVALRHVMRPPNGAMRLAGDDLEIDLERWQVRLAGIEVHLTPIEFKLLAALGRSAGKVVTHRQLLQQVWGEEYREEAHYLRVYVGQLRRKIEADPARPRHLRTEPGVGYRLVGVEPTPTQ